MLSIRSVITFVVCALLFSAQTAMGFAVVPSAARTMGTSNAMWNKPSTMTSTSRPAIVVDQAIAEMVSRSDPLGAIGMFVVIISLWELYTPGRVKK
jgi:hypothetical protein